MSEKPIKREGARSSGLVTAAYVLGVVALVALAWLLVRKVNNTPWSTRDTVLLVLTLAGAAFAVGVWWDDLAKVLGARGTLLNINATVTTFLVLGILVVLNYSIFARHLGYAKKDLTAKKLYSLSSQTINVLKEVKKSKKQYEMVGIMPQDVYSQGHKLEINRKQLEEYAKNCSAITTQMLDPNISSEGRQLSVKVTNRESGGVIVRQKDNKDVSEVVNSFEEADLTKAFVKLIDDKPRKVYVLTGHGEVGLTGGPDGPGLSALQKALERDRMTVTEQKFLGLTATIPADASAVVIGAPQQPYLPKELETLKAYIDGGGRLLVMLDPDAKSNLDELVKPYGIEYHPEVVTDPETRLSQDGQIFWGYDYGTHKSVSAFSSGRTRRVSLMMRTGYFKTGTVPPDMETAEVLKSGKNASSAKGLPKFDPTKPDTKPAPPPAAGAASGPLCLIMASNTKEKPEDAEKDKDKAKDAKAEPAAKQVRIAAVGCADFVSSPYAAQAANIDVAANLVAWLTDNTKVIGIRAKDTAADEKSHQITLSDAKRKWVLLLTVLLPLLVVFIAGVVVTVARARR